MAAVNRVAAEEKAIAGLHSHRLLTKPIRDINKVARERIRYVGFARALQIKFIRAGNNHQASILFIGFIDGEPSAETAFAGTACPAAPAPAFSSLAA